MDVNWRAQKKKKENMQLHKEGSSWDSNLWGESANHCPLCNLIFDSLNKKKNVNKLDQINDEFV